MYNECIKQSLCVFLFYLSLVLIYTEKTIMFSLFFFFASIKLSAFFERHTGQKVVCNVNMSWFYNIMLIGFYFF